MDHHIPRSERRFVGVRMKVSSPIYRHTARWLLASQLLLAGYLFFVAVKCELALHESTRQRTFARTSEQLALDILRIPIEANLVANDSSAVKSQCDRIAYEIQKLRIACADGDPAKKELLAADNSIAEIKGTINWAEEQRLRGAAMSQLATRFIALTTESCTRASNALIASQGNKQITLSNTLVDRRLLLYALCFLFGISMTAYYQQRKKLSTEFKHVRDNCQRFATRTALLECLPSHSMLIPVDEELHRLDLAVAKTTLREQEIFNKAAIAVVIIKSDGTVISQPTQARVSSSHRALIAQVNNSIFELVDTNQQVILERLIAEARRTREPSVCQIKINTNSNDTTDEQTECTILWNERDDTFFCTIKDLSEEVKFEIVKRQLADLIEPALRQPLESIRFEVNEASVHAIEGADKLLLKNATQHIDHLIEAIEDFRNFYSIEDSRVKLSRSMCDVGQIVQETFHLFASLATQKRLQTQFAYAPCQASIDRRLFTRLTENLLANAVRYTPSGGTMGATITHNQNGFELRIFNQGEPIPDRLKASIFEPFETGDTEGGRGSGVGLAVCQTIAKAHGGSIITDVWNGMTCFVVRIPFVDATPQKR